MRAYRRAQGTVQTVAYRQVRAFVSVVVDSKSLAQDRGVSLRYGLVREFTDDDGARGNESRFVALDFGKQLAGLALHGLGPIGQEVEGGITSGLERGGLLVNFRQPARAPKAASG